MLAAFFTIVAIAAIVRRGLSPRLVIGQLGFGHSPFPAAVLFQDHVVAWVPESTRDMKASMSITPSPGRARTNSGQVGSGKFAGIEAAAFVDDFDAHPIGVIRGTARTPAWPRPADCRGRWR